MVLFVSLFSFHSIDAYEWESVGEEISFWIIYRNEDPIVMGMDVECIT